MWKPCLLQIPKVEDRKTKLQNRILTSKRENDDFEALCKKIFKKENELCQNQEILLPKQHSQLTPPLQCDLQVSAEKHNSNTHAAATARKLDAATHCHLQTMSCKTQ